MDTCRAYLQAFADRFFPREPNRTIMPATIEQWLDEEMDAAPEHITGQKYFG